MLVNAVRGQGAADRARAAAIARIAAAVETLAAQLVPPTPAAARIMMLTEAVFVPPEPQNHRNLQSALAAVAEQVAVKVPRERDRSTEYRLGTVGDRAGLMLQNTIGGDLLSSQYLFLVDTENTVHSCYWYSR
ncbi:hypothetical protein [Kribbella sp. CA-294648]|uniref:hypothetical protein n=1 Tax=Kribbella sp. CA-294648 TaxID=3239948 RepID=UPI003D8A86F8